jgi:predicted phage baseplate assembly protein
MPLPTPGLDDRTFQSIVDEAKRLIPRYAPEWTNHNVADPGVALIELFAWMSEMVLYRVNQVPERLYTHFLNMVGIEPFPPSVARADLTFFLSAVLDQPVRVPANTQVMTATTGGNDSVVFSTVEELVVAPPSLGAAMTTTGPGTELAATDVWEDLRYRTGGVPVFASPELTPGDALALGFSASLAGMVLGLTVEAEAEGIGVDPTRPPLAWEVWNGEGWIPAEVHEDTTGGLNRGGRVVLLVPTEHAPSTIGDVSAYWLRLRLLPPLPGQPTYQASPRVRGVTVVALGGTVAAEHSEVMTGEVVGRSDGAPGQSFQVSRAPVLPRRDGEYVEVVDGDLATTWTEVGDFAQAGPDDKVYVWESGSGVVRFGPRVRYADGSVRQHGAIPRDGARIRVAAYRHGGGARGNVGARTLTLLRSTVPFVNSVANLARAAGGVDAETVAEAKVRGPLTLRTGQRAVTAGDFERLTLGASTEVARARCQPAGTDSNAHVQVLVVPQVRTDPGTHRLDDYALSPRLTATIAQHLDEHRVVGTAVEVSTPYYQGISVVTLLHGAPARPAAVVRQRVVEALDRYLNPLVGGVDGNGWPFDADVNTAMVTQLLELVDGVDRVDEVLLFEYDLRTGRRLGTAKDVIRLDRHSLFLSAAHQVVVR